MRIGAIGSFEPFECVLFIVQIGIDIDVCAGRQIVSMRGLPFELAHLSFQIESSRCLSTSLVTESLQVLVKLISNF